MTNKLAPILLFVYNRPLHTKQVIQSLLINTEAKDSELYIFSDGAKDNTQCTKVNEVRKYIEQIDGFKSIKIIYRDENWGLAKNIINGVTDIINKRDKVIVLEDDLLLAPYFLKFMNEALDTYQDEELVGHIQACDFTNNPNLPETYLIKWTGSWGWATWKRAWKLFEPNGLKLLNELKNQNLTKEFDFDGAYPYTKMLEKQTKGLNNSWAIRWNASLFLRNILSLNVGRSLVQNSGFDGSGTHCGGQSIYTSTLYQQPLSVQKILPIQENKEAKAILAYYYKKTNSLYAKAIRRIKRIINR